MDRLPLQQAVYLLDSVLVLLLGHQILVHGHEQQLMLPGGDLLPSNGMVNHLRVIHRPH